MLRCRQGERIYLPISGTTARQIASAAICHGSVWPWIAPRGGITTTFIWNYIMPALIFYQALLDGLEPVFMAGEIQPAFSGGDVSNISYPGLIGSVSRKVLVQNILSNR